MSAMWFDSNAIEMTTGEHCFARADNGKMRAANESYALKMNIIVILALNLLFVKRTVLIEIYSSWLESHRGQSNFLFSLPLIIS